VRPAAPVRSGAPVRTMEVRAALRMLSDNEEADLKAVFNDAIAVPSRKKWVTPKTPGQKRYVDAIRKHDMVFAIGPAGTGKSFLAVAMAVSALMKREVARIVLTRPAVEAGERLGFLPGDLYEKVHPYLRPLYDALYDMLEAEKVQTVRRGVEGIEFVYFDEGDVVRHRLVSAIVRAYDVHGTRTRDNGNAADGT